MPAHSARLWVVSAHRLRHQASDGGCNALPPGLPLALLFLDLILLLLSIAAAAAAVVTAAHGCWKLDGLLFWAMPMCQWLSEVLWPRNAE
eukprot:4089743-Amphidinium_carterae.1